MGNYNERALMVRILCHATGKKYYMSEENRIEGVKFFTREKDCHEASESYYNCYSSFLKLSLDNFYEELNTFLDPFEQAQITEQYWKEIVSCIDLFDYKYKEHERVEFWTSEKNPKTDQDIVEAIAKLSKEQQKYVSTFVTAFETNMKKGHAKKWIEELIKTIVVCLGEPDIQGFVPSRHDNINTVVETVFDDSDDSPYVSNPSSNTSSLSSLNLESPRYTGTVESLQGGDNKVTKHIAVPDYCVALPDFPGTLPLVFTLKPAYEEFHAIVQNIEQMLSKLFFQDVVFGIVVSPRSFQLSAIIKRGEDLHFASTPVVPIIKLKNGVKILDLKELNTMCTFIYQVLKWSKNTKCLLKVEGDSEGEM